MRTEDAAQAQRLLAREPQKRGRFRKAIDWWKRIDQALLELDCGPYDQMTDRIAILDARISKLVNRVSPDV